MNPVMSDLAIFVRQQEIEASTRSLRQAQLVRLAGGEVTGRGWFRRLADGLHQFVDPRGFALAQVRKEEAGNASEMPVVVAGSTVQAGMKTEPTVAASLVELVCDGREPDREERVAA
jgi:hypothetical protein